MYLHGQYSSNLGKRQSGRFPGLGAQIIFADWVFDVSILSVFLASIVSDQLVKVLIDF